MEPASLVRAASIVVQSASAGRKLGALPADCRLQTPDGGYAIQGRVHASLGAVEAQFF